LLGEVFQPERKGSLTVSSEARARTAYYENILTSIKNYKLLPVLDVTLAITISARAFVPRSDEKTGLSAAADVRRYYDG